MFGYDPDTTIVLETDFNCSVDYVLDRKHEEPDPQSGMELYCLL